MKSVCNKKFYGSLFFFRSTDMAKSISQCRLVQCDMPQNINLLQDGLTGSAWGDWANYIASPLRAFENELGVQAPTGFWDPAGFTADGSVENFKRRRQTELKHGRISMLATMGYITPEIFVGKKNWLNLVCLFACLFVCLFFWLVGCMFDCLIVCLFVCLIV